MKRPKQLPAVERKATIWAATIAAVGVRPSAIPYYPLVGQRPSPACRAVADRGCR
jgi:hypothetical protein